MATITDNPRSIPTVHALLDPYAAGTSYMHYAPSWDSYGMSFMQLFTISH